MADTSISSDRRSDILFLRYAPYGVGAVIILFAIVGGVTLVRTLFSPKQIANRVPLQPGIIVQQSYDGALPLKPIDQDKYRAAIQKAWEEALVKGSTNIVFFPKDPELVAFSYSPTDTPATSALVLYKNKPIILKTKKVLELPAGATSKITLSSQAYQLVVTFEYTPAVSELNIASTLKEAFEQAIVGKVSEDGSSAQARMKTVEAFRGL